MTTPQNHTIDAATIDQAWINTVVRQVIQEIKQIESLPSQANQNTTSLSEKIITVDTIHALPPEQTDVFVGVGAVITPAARDVAKELGIALHRQETTVGCAMTGPPTDSPSTAQAEVVDSSNPQRANAVLMQLQRRGIASIGSKIVLSNTPAADVYRYCTNEHDRAVLINSVTDIVRFRDELSPTVWVLDMKRINLVAAVNAAAQIAQKS